MLLMTFVRSAKHDWRGDAIAATVTTDDAEDDNITSNCKTCDILVQHYCH